MDDNRISAALRGRTFKDNFELLAIARELFPGILRDAEGFVPCDLDPESYLADNLLFLERVMAAHKEGRYASYVQYHDDAYKPYALLEASSEWAFSGVEFWRVLKDIWMMAHSTGYALDTWRKLFQPYIEPGIRSVLDRDELAVFANLPETVTAYRGAQETAKRGLSWSLNITTAEFFAKRTSGQVWRALVPRSAVLAYFAGRDESELVIDLPEHVIVEPYARSLN
jgi:hypothetical protein